MTLKMVSVNVRYLFYQPMDGKIKTWLLRFPAKENPNVEKTLFDWPIVSVVRSFVVSILFASFHFKVIRKSVYAVYRQNTFPKCKYPFIDDHNSVPGLKIILRRWPDTMTGQRRFCPIKSRFLTG